MSMEPVDYTAILADLEAKKAALEHTIASFRQAMALGALGHMSADGTVPTVAVPSLNGGEVPAGAFLGKSITEATRLYLEIVKKKQSTREIADALQKGGMESTSKGDFALIVHAGLTRARKSPNSGIVKVGTHWGLAAWYPKGIISAVAGPQGKKSKKRKPSKGTSPQAKHEASSKGPQPVGEVVISAEPNPAQRVLEILRVNSGAAFSPQETAQMLGLKPSAAPLILANLVRSHKAEKMADGKYRAVISEMSAAV